MTREEAALIVKDHAWGQANMLRMVDGDDSSANVLNEAVEIVCNAIRGPEWVRTADRLPAVEDGIIGATGEPEVLAVTRYAHGYFPDMKMVSKVREALGRKYFPYWMPLPKLPEVEG